jgi:hypothetical protein
MMTENSTPTTLPDPLPVCPTCGATGKACKRPSGHSAPGGILGWHTPRKQLLQDAVVCVAVSRRLVPAWNPTTDAAAAEHTNDPAGPREQHEVVRLAHIPLDVIDEHPHNPRRTVGDVTDLAASVAEVGILEPLVLAAPAAPNRVLFLGQDGKLTATVPSKAASDLWLVRAARRNDNTHFVFSPSTPIQLA